MRHQLITLVQAHQPATPLEENHKTATLEFLAANDNCTSQTNLEGHITASAWLLNSSYSQVLLTHHRKLERWFQLGGHVEDDPTIQDAALREAKEESGITEIKLHHPNIFDIDVHKIPARKQTPEHFHYDLRFLLTTSSTKFIRSNESKALRWVPVSTVNTLTNENSMLRMVEKTQRLANPGL